VHHCSILFSSKFNLSLLIGPLNIILLFGIAFAVQGLLNVLLIVINCELFSNIPQRLIDLCNYLDINKIYYNYEYEVNEKVT
jgi:hypothetical protein